MFRSRQNVYTSTLLRQHGYVYRVAFGCSLPDVKELVAQMRLATADPESRLYGADLTALAELLWSDEAVRESRLAAPMLYPRGTMTLEVAQRWARTIPTPEVADVLCMYAFQFTIGQQLIDLWLESPEPMLRYCAKALQRRLAVD